MSSDNQKNRFRQSVSALPLDLKILYDVSGKIWRLCNFTISWILAMLTSTVAFIYFFILNRTVVRGRENLRPGKNTLYLSNHQTMIDSFLVGMIITMPRLILRPSLIPWHPAAAENFFKSPLLAWFSARWKCIPVRRGQHDFEALEKMTAALSEGTMLIYPEGSRSRTGEVGEGRPGTGKLIHDTGARCVPVRVRGMERVLPVGSKFPRLFQRIEVVIGEEVPLDDLRAEPSSKETSRAVIARVMEQIRRL